MRFPEGIKKLASIKMEVNLRCVPIPGGRSQWGRWCRIEGDKLESPFASNGDMRICPPCLAGQARGSEEEQHTRQQKTGTDWGQENHGEMRSGVDSRGPVKVGSMTLGRGSHRG